MAALDDAIATGQKFQEERDSAQVSLFGDMPAATTSRNGRKLPDIAEWQDKEKLGFEKEALGFLITGHPLDRYIDDIKRIASAEITRLPELPDGIDVRLCGIVTAFREIITKKGDRMCFATIEDLSGSIEITVFPDIYADCSTLLKTDDPLVVSGKLEKTEKGCKLLVMRPNGPENGRKGVPRSPAGDVRLLQDVQAQTTTRVNLALRLPDLSAELITPLRGLIERHPGALPVTLSFEQPNQFMASHKLPDNLKVAASDEFRLEVERLVGYNAVIFE
jgi:DNA polymerase-3 subunit alpha